jgi:phosphohistidine phosphatase
VQGVAPSAHQVLLVGHNPEIQTFALDLIGSGAKHLKDRLETKYPTAGLVVLCFLTGGWKDLALNSGKLELFLSPKNVERS